MKVIWMQVAYLQSLLNGTEVKNSWLSTRSNCQGPSIIHSPSQPARDMQMAQNQR